jgi:geranylgeranyl diphosphate synthase, type II
MPVFDLKSYLSGKAGEIDQRLDRLLPDRPARLVRAMRHSLMDGGKRVRPALCVAAAEAAAGGADDAVVRAACAIEMIHTYSLIHDDLPAMDDDALRRGKPTCHVAFDEAAAILAGDALLTLAFETLATLPPEAGIQVVGVVARAAGYEGMIEGQMRDMAAEEAALGVDALAGVHALKTGALIRAAVKTGAILAGAGEERIGLLDRYAEKIGLAFQVTDDLLNVEGDPALLGKAVGTDRVRGKSTYPALLGAARSRELAEALVEEALDALHDFDRRADPLRAIARYIVDRNR